MHWPGRVCADIFHVDRPGGAGRASPVGRAFDENVSQDLLVNLGAQDDIDESRSCDLGLENVWFQREVGDETLSKLARTRAGHFRLASVDHRRVGREVAVGRVARRLDEKAAEIETARQFARCDPLFNQRRHAGLEIRKNVHSVAAQKSRASNASPKGRQKDGRFRGWRNGRSFPRCSRRRRGRAPPAPPSPPSRAA